MTSLQIGATPKGSDVEIRELQIGENEPIPPPQRLRPKNGSFDCSLVDTVSRVSVGFAEDQNRRFRRTMEDGHTVVTSNFIHPEDGLFAIFDGHGGIQSMEVARERFHIHLKQSLMTEPSIRAAIQKAYALTDEDIAARKVRFGGCTAAVALVLKFNASVSAPLLDVPNPILQTASKLPSAEESGVFAPMLVPHFVSASSTPKRFLFASNVGDARVVLIRKGKGIRLTYDHKCDDPSEEARIRNSGGFIFGKRVSGILAITRALGDTDMKEWVVSDPHIEEVELCDDDTHIVVACDGVFDVLSDQQVADIVTEVSVNDSSSSQDVAETLLQSALDAGTTDNVSIMVVHLEAEMDSVTPKTLEMEDLSLVERTASREGSDMVVD